MIKYLASISAGLGALNLFLQGTPGADIPTYVVLAVGGSAAFLAAMVAVLSNGASK